MIPYGRQDIDQHDIQAVVDVLNSDFITQGQQVPAFEDRLCKLTGAHHAVAANSATSCLHIACLAMGLCRGDRLWTSPISFVASANCGLYCGATVDFVDIDPLTANIDPSQLQVKLEQAFASNSLPKILVVVHMAGSPCEMERISELARRYGVAIIEDASHAIGASYRDQPVGDCRHSDITIFSFHPVKIITTAEGGAAMTNCAELARKMGLFRTHGVTRDADLLDDRDAGPWWYEQHYLGFNYRMTELQAALGLSQLNRLGQFVDRRNALATRYDQSFATLPLSPILPLAGSRSAYHLYLVLLDPSFADHGRRQVFNELRELGVGVNVHYIPIHIQPLYRTLGFDSGDFPGAETYYSRTLSLPLFPGLDETKQGHVIDSVVTALNHASWACNG